MARAPAEEPEVEAEPQLRLVVGVVGGRIGGAVEVEAHAIALAHPPLPPQVGRAHVEALSGDLVAGVEDPPQVVLGVGAPHLEPQVLAEEARERAGERRAVVAVGLPAAEVDVGAEAAQRLLGEHGVEEDAAELLVAGALVVVEQQPPGVADAQRGEVAEGPADVDRELLVGAAGADDRRQVAEVAGARGVGVLLAPVAAGEEEALRRDLPAAADELVEDLEVEGARRGVEVRALAEGAPVGEGDDVAVDGVLLQMDPAAAQLGAVGRAQRPGETARALVAADRRVVADRLAGEEADPQLLPGRAVDALDAGEVKPSASSTYWRPRRRSSLSILLTSTYAE